MAPRYPHKSFTYDKIPSNKPHLDKPPLRQNPTTTKRSYESLSCSLQPAISIFFAILCGPITHRHTEFPQNLAVCEIELLMTKRILPARFSLRLNGQNSSKFGENIAQLSALRLLICCLFFKIKKIRGHISNFFATVKVREGMGEISDRERWSSR